MSSWPAGAKALQPATHETNTPHSEFLPRRPGAPAARPKLPTLKPGLAVHADTSVVVRSLDNRAPQPAQKFSPARFLARVPTRHPLAEAAHRGHEAGPFGYGLRRDLVALGVRNLVVQPVCPDERHKSVHHDKRDARALAWRLVRWPPGSVRVKQWWPVLGHPKATRAAKQPAIVALARQRAVDWWRWRTGRAQPESFGWTMVGAAAA